MRFVKFVFIVNILFLNIYIVSAQSVVAFTKRTINLGKIALEDGTAIANFDFKSVGRDYLMIKNVSPDQDDVDVIWDKRIYQKGKEGVLTVSFEPQREGVFKRKITVETNGTKRNSFILILTGEVIKTGKEPVVKDEKKTIISAHKTSYPTTFKMSAASDKHEDANKIDVKETYQQLIFSVFEHGFAMTTRVIDFNRIRKGDKVTRTFKIKNNTGEKRDIYFAPLFEYIEYKATPKTLKAGEEGEISVTFDSKKCPIWGTHQKDFFLVTEVGSTAKNSPVICFQADIFEDFNSLTDEEKRVAPRATFETTLIDLGKIDSGTRQKIKFKFSNEGKNPLQIRKITPASDNLNIVYCDGKVATGEKGVLELELNPTKFSKGNYTDKIILQTNDPHNPTMELKVNWTI
ncbi:MAG: DUF1573 domain-containing protein [Paludibacter sp.]|nr:DUF1573 domain-containing protein [Paludibacter sp.]